MRSPIHKLSLVIAVIAICSTAAVAQKADNEYQVGALLWTQTSAEKAALSYQAFSLARLRLDQDFRTNRNRRVKRAVIVDVDETVLDNSPYQAKLAKEQKPFEAKTWTDWCNSAQATALPGAVEFLRYADSRGVRVFYITNRRVAEKDGTARNLRALGFPDVTDDTLLVRTDGSTKEPRRQSVATKYRIVLLMGDNLNDFAEVFEKSKTIDTRLSAAAQNKNQFGSRFIVLPNPMYGAWEDAVYGEGRLTDEQKAEKRKATLRGY